MEENKEKEKIYYIPIEDIIPNRFQPRLAFDERELNELANSIIKYGVIQPIVLRNIGDKYEIIAGERRYKASCLAGLKKVPAIINNTTIVITSANKVTPLFFSIISFIFYKIPS